MLIRRCQVLLIEARERLEFDLAVLFQGDQALAARVEWVALAPHREEERVIDAREWALLGSIGESLWVEREPFDARHGAECVDALLDAGLLLAFEAPPERGLWRHWRERDQRLRDSHWRPLNAAAHYASRWSSQNVKQDGRLAAFKDLRELVAAYGAMPQVELEYPEAPQVALPAPLRTALDECLARRTTCRNFVLDPPLPLADFASMMHRCFAAQAEEERVPGARVLKKTSPSGGSLHPLSAFVLIRAVEGLAPGLYHYHAQQHRLAAIDTDPATDWQARARLFVADQHWFADAAFSVILVARFRRNFWKYRNHPKALRAITLDAGHLSQTLYLSATELGYGAFITAAINEIDIEQALGLDPLVASPIAILGCGRRGAHLQTVELDPAAQVWDERQRRWPEA